MGRLEGSEFRVQGLKTGLIVRKSGLAARGE
jgi:hypothetical protein